jgi:signal transduction protein with GAF and PtsI domain
MRIAAQLELGLTLAAQRESQPMLDLFCLAAQDIMGTRYVGIIIADAERDTAQQWSASGLADTPRADLGSIDLGHGFMGEVMRGDAPVCLRMLVADAAHGGLPASHPVIAGLLAIRQPEAV